VVPASIASIATNFLPETLSEAYKVWFMLLV